MTYTTIEDMDQDEKIKENRLRRRATTQGLTLVKTNRKDRRAVGYGKFWVLDPYNRTLVGAGLSLDEVEALLDGKENVDE
jgi:hypothetical protein